MNYLINLIKEASRIHRHANYEIIVYVGDGGIFGSEGKTLSVSCGGCVIVPPDTEHWGSGDRIYVSGDFNHPFNLSSPAVINGDSEKEAVFFAKMIYKNRYESFEYTAALCNAFLHFLMKNLKTDTVISLAVKGIADEITNGFSNPDMNVSDVLKKSGYSEDYIRAQFRRILRKTPVEFLTEVRINHACYLMDTYGNSVSLSRIAEMCGFEDYVYFSRRFKKFMGISPRKYNR